MSKKGKQTLLILLFSVLSKLKTLKKLFFDRKFVLKNNNYVKFYKNTEHQFKIIFAAKKRV
jgi:hypothetical protein